ncbi:MAG TPA: cytochrome b/b6 domain-containing protein [Aromatoleum sp.]|uniref:cytochrome b/b6 domain-containing protein n=1 Tax=Aromatoleum sp. TaxID=2307007 RepID=UPI002B49C27C|nr:cytochrome b/b6 domain-containing protein [Aromatoleum sp.]HJV25763.1 cytochrome b/b6 domain-containing protein [Aromatoleum sp.]
MNRRPILLWDLPTRLAHWLLVALVAGAIVSVKVGGNAMEWHGRIGLAIVAVVSFRIAWGLVGSTYARFAHFAPTPATLRAYLRGDWRGVGHNPLGALSVFALLSLMAAQALAGAFANDDIAFYGPLYRAVSAELSTLLTGLHRKTEWLVYGLVVLHVAAIMFHTHVKKDNLIAPMITGRKTVADPTIAPAQGGGVVALVFALVLAALATWAVSGGFLPAAPEALPASVPAW